MDLRHHKPNRLDYLTGVIVAVTFTGIYGASLGIVVSLLIGAATWTIIFCDPS